jgi:hypothetical protein
LETAMALEIAIQDEMALEKGEVVIMGVINL